MNNPNPRTFAELSAILDAATFRRAMDEELVASRHSRLRRISHEEIRKAASDMAIIDRLEGEH